MVVIQNEIPARQHTEDGCMVLRVRLCLSPFHAHALQGMSPLLLDLAGYLFVSSSHKETSIIYSPSPNAPLRVSSVVGHMPSSHNYNLSYPCQTKGEHAPVIIIPNPVFLLYADQAKTKNHLPQVQHAREKPPSRKRYYGFSRYLGSFMGIIFIPLRQDSSNFIMM